MYNTKIYILGVKMKLKPCHYKIQIKPDTTWEVETETDSATNINFYKTDKNSKIVVAAKSTNAAKDRNEALGVGTIVAMADHAGYDDETAQVKLDQFEVGDKVLYTNSNLMAYQYKKQFLYFINSQFIIAKVLE
jgi:co-chaperonin GroES (HSP10)